MEKDVARWLHANFGYNAGADASLAANCRGTLKGLWSFLLTNYRTPESVRHVAHVIAKQRSEAEAARLEPERRRAAAAARQTLAQLDGQEAMLSRTLASLQAAVSGGVTDAVEQAGEQALYRQELREAQTQAAVLRAALHRFDEAVPALQARLARLKAMADVARTRCEVAGSSTQRAQTALRTLQQACHEISAELLDVIENGPKQQQQQQHVNEDGTDDGNASSKSLHPNWSRLSLGNHLERCSLVCGYSPSQDVQARALSLLQEPPALLLACVSQLAAQASQQLAAVLDEAEEALTMGLLPAEQPGMGSTDDASRQQQQQGPAVATTADASAANSVPSLPAAAPAAGVMVPGSSQLLPWSTPWVPGGAAADPLAAQRSPELLVKQRQQAHLSLFVQARAARGGAAAADAALTQLLGATPLLLAPDDDGNTSSDRPGAGSWEAQLARLWLTAEGLRAQLAVLEQRRSEFEVDLDACLQAEAGLQAKWRAIEAAVSQDQAANQLLWRVAGDVMELWAELGAVRHDSAALLLDGVVQAGRRGTAAAAEACGRLQQEVAALSTLPLTTAVPAERVLLLSAPQPPQVATGGSPAVRTATTTTTLGRLDQAAQRLSHVGRPTTLPRALGQSQAAAPRAAGNNSTERMHGMMAADSTAVAVLRAVAGIDAVAAAMCPGALLLAVAGESAELARQDGSLQQLQALCMTATDSGAQARQQLQQLRRKVDAVRTRDQSEVLPLLLSASDSAAEAHGPLADALRTDIEALWALPAQSLLPDLKHEGQSCSQWLQEVQALHGRKRELGSQLA